MQNDSVLVANITQNKWWFFLHNHNRVFQCICYLGFCKLNLDICYNAFETSPFIAIKHSSGWFFINHKKTSCIICALILLYGFITNGLPHNMVSKQHESTYCVVAVSQNKTGMNHFRSRSAHRNACIYLLVSFTKHKCLVWKNNHWTSMLPSWRSTKVNILWRERVKYVPVSRSITQHDKLNDYISVVWCNVFSYVSLKTCSIAFYPPAIKLALISTLWFKQQHAH